MTIADRVFKLLVKTGKGFTNDELVIKAMGMPPETNTRASIRVAIRTIREAGTPVVKKARYDKATGKMLPAKYFIPVSQDTVMQMDTPRGRPRRDYAVPA